MTLLIAALLALPAARAWAAFDGLPSGARPAGLAGACTAAADDANALFFNPAGLKEIGRPELAMQYGRLLGGLSDGSNLSQGMLAFARPLPGRGTAAFSYASLRLSGLYEERVISLGYGRGFLDGRLGAGLALKHLHAGYGSGSGDAPDPALADRAGKSALGLDFGLLYQWTPRVRLGFAALNLNRPNVGLGASSPVTRTAAWGAAVKLGPGTLSADVLRQEVLDDSADLVGALGYEGRRDFEAQTVFLRGGGRAGSRGQRQLNFGLGWRRGALQLDYAMTVPVSNLQPSNQSQQVSATYRFGPAR